MTRMWRGPAAELKEAQADPLWAAIHRRGGRLGVACNVESDGRTADFWRVEKRGADFYQVELGRVRGADPYMTVLNGYRRWTPLDAELVSLNVRYLEREALAIVADCRLVVSKLEQAVESFL